MKSFVRLLVLPVLVAIFATPAVARNYDHCARGAYGPLPYAGYSRGYAPVIDYRYVQFPHYGYFGHRGGYVHYLQPPYHSGYYRHQRIYRPTYGYGYRY